MHLRPARRHGGRPSHAVCGAASPIRVEWPTILLAASVYLIFGLLTWFYHALPWWLVLPLGGYLVGLHGSLQHEAIHGHPTNRPWLNELAVFPNLWLWLPFRIYREDHTRHHETEELADPIADPESFYVSQSAWQTMPELLRIHYWARNTLLGRTVLGPADAVWKTARRELQLILRGDFQHSVEWALHAFSVALVLAWVVGVCEIPFVEYILLFAYPGLALTMLRSYLEHRTHPDPAKRTVVVEAEPVLAFLFLNNNLHALHHAEPHLAWYQLPGYYRQERARLLSENGGYRFSGYWEIVRLFLLRAKETPRYPAPRAR